MRIRTVWLFPLVSAVLLASCGRPADPPSAVRTSPPRPNGTVQQLSQPEGGQVAGPVEPDPRVGAFFFDGASAHACTGSVVHSTAGDLVLTAAHCLSGSSAATFVPGLNGDAAPTDQWTVNQLYFDSRWLTTKDPRADYVFARVSSPSGRLESHVGKGLLLGTAPFAGNRVKITAYAAGKGGRPLGCQARTGVTVSGFPSIACEGLVSGTSGAPWVSDSAVVGLIGGLQGGGCEENMSYSPAFDDRTAQLLARAEMHGPGDTVPSDYEDPC